MDPLPWNIYLAGDVESSWRDDVIGRCEKANVPAVFLGPMTDSVKRGAFGAEQGKIDAMRACVLIETADIVVAQLDEESLASSAFGAGYAVALRKPVIALHDAEAGEAYQEVDAMAFAVAHDVEQIVEILKYVTEGAVIARKKRSVGFGPGSVV